MWENLFIGLNEDDPWKILYHFYLYIRKIGYSVILVFLTSMPKL